MTVVVVDYGMGNLGSVAKALEKVSGKLSVKISSDPAQVDAAERVVFPGQGAMPDCMRFLNESGLMDAVLRACRSKPLFGVCVGEQMLLTSSDEASVPGTETLGLDVLPGRVRRFSGQDADGSRLKVPHMGWNRVRQARHNDRVHPLFADIPDLSFFYFVHSYYAVTNDANDVAAESDYGDRFTCAVARDNIFATQFHPEKSAALGLKLYENFLSWRP